MPLTVRASSWPQGPQGVRQEEAEQSRAVQVSNSKRKDPEEAAEETQDETQLVEAAEQSFGVRPTVTSSGVHSQVGPKVEHCCSFGTPAFRLTVSSWWN